MDNQLVEEIWKELLDQINDEYDKTEGYLIADLLKAVAIVLSGLSTEMDDTEKLLNVDNLTGDLLAAFIKHRKGIERSAATFAVGQVNIQGNGTVTRGDLFETVSGIQFAATETKLITGIGNVKIGCVVSGSIGNVPVNQITQMPVTIPGITSVTNTVATQEGYEAESDENLRNRYYIAIQTPATSGNVYHYLQWAKSFSGVGDAKVIPLGRGDNTVEIVIINQDKLPASETLVAQVQEYIDPENEGLGLGQAPIGAKCYVVSAHSLIINCQVNVIQAAGYTPELVKQNVETSLSEYFKSIAFKSDYISAARVVNAILDSEGVEDCSNLLINGQANNLPIESKEIPVLGVVTIV